jgi:hypothetical protein
MSNEVEMRYQIEKQRRQALFDARVRETTSGFVARYRQILEDVSNNGLIEYVSREFSSLSATVDEIEHYLDSNPAMARELSQQVSDRVFSLPRVARAAYHAAEQARREAERQRIAEEKKLRQELEKVWQTNLLSWTDPLARQLVFPELTTLRNQLFNEGTNVTQDIVTNELQKVRSLAEQKSHSFKAEQERLAIDKVQQEKLQELKEQIAITDADPERLEQLSAALENLNSLDSESIRQQTNNISKALDDAVVDESCRKEVVKAIYQSLQKSGFTVDKPRRDKETDEVIIKAARPAGAQARFKVKLNGSMEYKFHRYKGSTCKEDINKVLPSLQEIYGIQLSDERVIWQNPDDQDRDAIPQPTMRGNIGGK